MSEDAQDAPVVDPAPEADDTSNTEVEPGGQQLDESGLDDHTRKVIDAIRGDYKAERAKRQAAEKSAADAAAKAAKDAAETARNELTQQLGKALGLVPEDAADPDKLAKELSSKDVELRQSRIELALYQAAARPEIGADPHALLDSRGFMNKVAKFDPASDTFAADLESAIKTAVEANPKLRADQAAAVKKSGAPMPGAPKPPAKAKRPNSIHEAVNRTFGGSGLFLLGDSRACYFGSGAAQHPVGHRLCGD